jgi:hypothetical protein
MRTNASCIAACAALLGCSHIPDPADVPGVEPYQILQNIRCEIAEVLLTEYPHGSPEYYWVREADIGYGLRLNAAETKNASGDITWVWPIHLGTFTLNLNAGKEKSRSGESDIILAEELQATLAMLDGSHRPPEGLGPRPYDCNTRPPLHTLAYPILGSIGMSDIIRRFVEVNTIASTQKTLGAPTDDPLRVDVEGKFIYTLLFTLKFLAGVKPSFEIKRLDGRELKGNADVNGSRLDTHTLIIAMAPPTLDEVRDAKRGRRPGIATRARRVRSSIRAERQRSLTNQIQTQQYLQRLPLLPLPLR